jgi:hypothetical protein
MKDLPSEEELFAGVMKDGSRPPLHSRELYEKHVVDGFGRPLPPELRDKTETEITAADLEFEADLILLDDLDYCRDMGHFLANTGRAALEDEDTDETAGPAGDRSTSLTTGGPESAPQADDSNAQASTQPETPKGSDPLPDNENASNPFRFPYLDGPRALPGGKAVVPESPVKPTALSEHERAKKKRKYAEVMKRREREFKNSKRRASKATIKSLTKTQASSLIHHGCRLIKSVTEQRAEVFKRLIKHAMQQELKEAFYWDRAHAVVAATLLHLDDTFEDVGFGSWMPFRFPDQWMMFCGTMRRVLAANGLLHADQPDQYRKLLEETEYPDPKIKNIDERIKWWKTPQNWSTLWRFRGADNLEVLKQRLNDEVWDPTTQFGGTRAPP